MRRKPSTRGLAHLSAVLPGAASGPLRSRGFAQSAILTRWREIVGEDIGASSCPERLTFPRGENGGATLRIRAAGGLALELQHLEPVVVDRVNRFFGYAAVARIALIQGPLPKSASKQALKSRILTLTEEEEINAQVAKTTDPGLRAALRSLGRAVRAQTPA